MKKSFLALLNFFKKERHNERENVDRAIKSGLISIEKMTKVGIDIRNNKVNQEAPSPYLRFIIRAEKKDIKIKGHIRYLRRRIIDGSSPKMKKGRLKTK